MSLIEILDVLDNNDKKILIVLNDKGKLNRSELAKLTKLAGGTVDKHTSILAEHEFIKRHKTKGFSTNQNIYEITAAGIKVAKKVKEYAYVIETNSKSLNNP